MFADAVDSHRIGSGRGVISKEKRNEVRLLFRERLLKRLQQQMLPKKLP